MKNITNRKIKIKHKGMFAIGEFDQFISDEDARKILIEDIERQIPKDYPEFKYSCTYCDTDQKPYKKILGVGGFASPNSIEVFVCPVCLNHEHFDSYKRQSENYELILNKKQTNGFF